MSNTGEAAPTEHGPTLDVTHARQGRRGKHVLWILIASLILVVAALFGSWAMRAPQLATTESNSGRTSPEARAFTAPEAAVKQKDVMLAPGVAGDTSPASQSAQTP